MKLVNPVLFKLGQNSFWILIWLSWVRLIVFSYSVFPDHGWHKDVAKAFFAGFRFDLLVLGFLWIPLFFIFWIFYFSDFLPRVQNFLKAYFVIIVISLGFISIYDYAWFDIYKIRMTATSFNEAGFWSFIESFLKISQLSAMALILAPMVVLIFFILTQKLVTSKSSKLRPHKRILEFPQVLLSFLLIASAARGTWTAHHLNIEHAQVSELAILNQLALSPVWNLDKSP